MPPFIFDDGPPLATGALPVDGPMPTCGGLVRLGFALARISIASSELTFLNLRRADLASSSLTRSSSTANAGAGGFARGSCGVLLLKADDSDSSLRPPPIIPLTTILALELSPLRRGLTAGSGGGEIGSAKLPFLDLVSRASCDNFVVGTRDVDITKVGSEMSLLLMDRFMASVTVLPEGRLEGGRVGVEAFDPGADP